eukprot:scaffold181350_cov28-Tisochrysis_lutea.AAC.3
MSGAAWSRRRPAAALTMWLPRGVWTHGNKRARREDPPQPTRARRSARVPQCCRARIAPREGQGLGARLGPTWSPSHAQMEPQVYPLCVDGALA